MSQADIQKAQEAVARAQADLAQVRATRGAETTTTASGIELERQATRQLIAAQQDLQRVQQAAAGTPPDQSVSPAQSPIARQVESSIAEDYGINVQGTSQADIDRQRRINESLERSAYLDAQEEGRTYVPGEATGDPSAGFTPPEPQPGAVQPREVRPDVSPVAEQAEEPTRTSRRQRAQAQRSAQQDPEVVQQAEESVGEFSDQQRDVSVEPEVPAQDEVVEREATGRRARAQAARVREREPEDPTEDAEVNEQQSNRERAQDQRIENANAEDLDPLTSPAASQVDSTVSRRAQAQIQRHESIVRSDPTSYESLTDDELRQQTASTKAALDSLDALPTQERLRVQAQIDALENQLDLLDTETARRSTRGRLDDQVASGKRIAEDVDPEEDKTVPQNASVEDTAASEDININSDAQRLAAEAEARAVQAEALLNQARNQATVSEQRKANGTAVGDGDWRVRLRLAPNATYLYKAQEPGILAPLLATDGVIFPYTPQIDVAYRSNYQAYSPTHSNYKHYFYQGSSVEFVTMTADFTAQDTQEAEYLLAVIHFMKSASKMFYGQDNERGSPPPLLYLTGLGEYQFNEAPCVIQEFNYNLPNNVDYIRARSRQISGADTLQYQRPLSSSTAPSYSLSAIWDRLKGSNLPQGATPSVPAPSNLGLGSPTYVPSKLSMTITLLPVQSRSQVSQQFSLRDYANGNLIKNKGFW